MSGIAKVTVTKPPYGRVMPTGPAFTQSPGSRPRVRRDGDCADMNRVVALRAWDAARLVPVWSVLLLSAGAHAQDVDGIQTLDAVQVSASLLPTTAAAATQHVTVLDRATLDAAAGVSVGELLSRQAGVVIDRSSRSGGFGSLYLRGADPSHVVVLIDGVRQNDPLSSRGSAVDLNTLSTGDIERIEIVRGNVSVVHAEALAGLIHIFTRRGRSVPIVGVSVGGDGLRAAHASWSGAQARLGGSHREDGDGAGGFSRVRAANAGFDQSFGTRVQLRADARVSDSEQRAFPDDSGGVRLAVIRELETRRARSHQLSVDADLTNPGGSSLQIQATSIWRDGDEDSSGVTPGLRDPFGLPAIRSHGDYRRHALQAVWLIAAGDKVHLTVGAHHQQERGKLDSLIRFGPFDLPASFTLERSIDSLFAEGRWQHADWTLQGGLRHERPDRGDATTHPMLSVRRRLGEGGGQWGASFARSEKLPSFYALGHPLVGNPLLRAERANHRELYFGNAETAAWPTRLTLFSARYSDLVDFDSGPPPQLVNRTRIQADGVEWRTGHRFANQWSLQLDGSWTRVRDAADEVTLRYRPRLQWSAQLQLPAGTQRDLSLALRHLGRRFDSSIPTGDRWLSPVTTLDLSLIQRVGATQLVLALDNALDRRQDETIGTPVGGRRLRFSLLWALR